MADYSAVPARERDVDLSDPDAIRQVHSSSPGFDSTPDLSLGGNLPSGAAQPRFLGRAANESGPSIRDSYASSQHSQGASGASEYGASVYALNTGGSYRDDPNAPSRFSNYYADEDDGVQMSNMATERGGPRMLEEKRSQYAGAAVGKKGRQARWGLIILGALIVLLLVVLLPIYFTVIKKKSDSADGNTGSAESSTGGKDSGGKASGSLLAVAGAHGSDVVLEDGSSFTYGNKLGGSWYYDINEPFKNGGKAQSYSPAINETWKWGQDRVFGVNIGGWLVTEPFIVPALYQKYSTHSPPPVDEWTLMEAMGSDKEKLMKEHYETFITEKDFAEIAAAGLNFVRIPIGYWVIETRGNEPFVPGLSWTYFLKAVGWARKYGLRVNMDLHAAPGSQNGWNHSGKLGTQNMLLGPMGLANAQRTLDYIRILAEFASQDQYKDVISIFGILNEPQGTPTGQDILSSFYLKAYDIVRTASGNGEGKGPWVSFHDGFFARDKWKGFLAGADRIQLDDHPYLCFATQSSDPIAAYATRPCETWGSLVNTSMSDFGMTHAGEFSNAVTDCGLYVNGVGLGMRYEGSYDGYSESKGDCEADWLNWQKWSDTTKQDYKNFAMASMDALHHFFFWTWKIGNSSESNRVESPQWSYQLGLENGWMPEDPRESVGYCKNTSPFTGTIAGSSDGNIAADVRSQMAWPPASISSAGAASSLPQYTPTGTLVTLKGAAPTITGSVSGKAAPSPTSTIDVGSGWKNSDDKEPMMVEKSGCSYLDPWIGPTAAVPPPC